MASVIIRVGFSANALVFSCRFLRHNLWALVWRLSRCSAAGAVVLLMVFSLQCSLHDSSA